MVNTSRERYSINTGQAILGALHPSHHHVPGMLYAVEQ